MNIILSKQIIGPTPGKYIENNSGTKHVYFLELKSRASN
ncbi:hypothetical protein EV11_0155 [Prochlorococcus sp. SS52]|nr:hypothetical protein EV08_0002 [Prochlorococcus marinus str. SS2]KGG37451.1 hypothetical protein EV11_0155 [Prochlorococcus sp. SS52]